jgi:hypothetical protein
MRIFSITKATYVSKWYTEVAEVIAQRFRVNRCVPCIPCTIFIYNRETIRRVRRDAVVKKHISGWHANWNIKTQERSLRCSAQQDIIFFFPPFL